MHCPKCGGMLLGDGYMTALYCENTRKDHWSVEPDSDPVLCNYPDEDEEYDDDEDPRK